MYVLLNLQRFSSTLSVPGTVLNMQIECEYTISTLQSSPFGEEDGHLKNYKTAQEGLW